MWAGRKMGPPAHHSDDLRTRKGTKHMESSHVVHVRPSSSSFLFPFQSPHATLKGGSPALWLCLGAEATVVRPCPCPCSL